MRKDITVVAEARETRGKNEARRLRVRKLSPAVIYGGTDKGPLAVSVSPKEIHKILRSSSGHNTIFNLDIQGVENTPVMIVDWLFDPVKENLLHVDFKRVDLTQRIAVKVPVHLTGDPVGVKIHGGHLEVVTREIEIECLPDDIPEHFTYAIGDLNIGGGVRASDVPLTGSMRLLSPAEQVVAHVVGKKAEEVAEEAAAKTAAAAEPEVVKKGKKEAEPEAGGDKKKK